MGTQRGLNPMASDLPPKITTLRQAQRAFLKAQTNRAEAIRELAREGFSEDAIELALRFLEGSPEKEYDVIEEVGKILEGSKSNVRVSMLAYVETEEGDPDKSARQRAYESGVEHRLAGEKATSCPFSPGPLSDQWLRGWKEAYQVTKR